MRMTDCHAVAYVGLAVGMLFGHASTNLIAGLAGLAFGVLLMHVACPAVLRAFGVATLALAIMLGATSVQASDCPNGRCPLQLSAGQPVRNAVKAPVIVAAKVAKAAVVLPAKVVKGTAHVFRERKPVRRVCRGVFRVATFRGPILTRMRAHRCH